VNVANLLRRAAADHAGQVALLPRTGSGELNRPELRKLFP
jgi:hypothetical protein